MLLHGDMAVLFALLSVAGRQRQCELLDLTWPY